MFTDKHYIPILKAKEGEFRALREVSDEIKDWMTPLLEVINITWNFEDEQEAKSIDDHLSKIGKKIQNAWGVNRRIFVDSNLIEGDRKMEDGITHHLTHLFNDFRVKGLNALPVTSLDRVTEYKDAVKSVINLDNKGLCLRLTNSDFTNTQLAESLTTELSYYGISPAEVDLIIDFGSITAIKPELFVLPIITLINGTIPFIHEWRSVTIAASGFPVDLRDISAGTIDIIHRTEWIAWFELRKSSLKRYPAFGDYSIAHPEVSEIDPRMINTSASIRYTHDTYWLIVRGKGTKKHGWEQYYSLCANLITRPEYCGSHFSWGDNYINECALKNTGPGNATTWRKVSNNHHFHKTVFQISSLPSI